MKCPKCNKEGAKYLHRKSESYSSVEGTKKNRMATTDKIGKCKYCGYEGEI